MTTPSVRPRPRSTAIAKEGIDAFGKKYWTDFFKDSGYGAIWVRDIKTKIRAALEKAAGPRVVQLEMVPLGQAVTATGLTVEGTARGYANGPGGKLVRHAMLFVADLSPQGELLRIETMPSP